MDDLITNVTLLVTPALITRQRDNAGQQRRRAPKRRSATAGAACAPKPMADGADEFAGGAWLPQMPRQQALRAGAVDGERTWLAAGVRGSGLQFEDDLNRFRLPGYAVCACFGAASPRREVGGARWRWRTCRPRNRGRIQPHAAVGRAASDQGRNPLRNILSEKIHPPGNFQHLSHEWGKQPRENNVRGKTMKKFILSAAALLILTSGFASAQATNARIRVVHASPDAPAVDITVNGGRFSKTCLSASIPNT
jgi:hypothetical protein